MNLIKFYRIPDWIKIVGIVFVALLVNNLVIQNYVIFLVVSLLFAYSFSINNYYDAKLTGERNYLYDRLNGKTFFLCMLPAILAVLISFFLNVFLCIISIIFINLMWIYSSPPLRLKRVPFIDLILNIICFGMIPYIIAISYPNLSIDLIDILLVLIFSFYVGYSEILHQLAHISEDRRSKVNSVPRQIGERYSYYLLILFAIVPILLSSYYLAVDLVIYSFLIITIGFSLLRLIVLIKTKDYEWLRDNSFGFFEGITYVMYFLLLLL